MYAGAGHSGKQEAFVLKQIRPQLPGHIEYMFVELCGLSRNLAKMTGAVIFHELSSRACQVLHEPS